MHEKNGRSDVLDSRFWREVKREEFQAVTLLSATRPVHEVLAYLDAIPAARSVGSVPKALALAIDALSNLDQHQRLRSSTIPSGTMAEALAALRNLERTMTAESEDRDLEVPDDACYLADPPALENDLRQAVAQFLQNHLDTSYHRVATFSLILFSDEMHEGALAASFCDERSEWKKAIQPPRRGTPDMHLAIIPPPTAGEGVRYLAAELKCEENLPCVIFLGRKPDFSNGLHNLLPSWGCRKLVVVPPKYPKQLRQIYRTVYAHRALSPGNPASAIADKVLTAVRGALNPRAALRLFAGAVGGSKLVQATDLIDVK